LVTVVVPLADRFLFGGFVASVVFVVSFFGASGSSVISVFPGSTLGLSVVGSIFGLSLGVGSAFGLSDGVASGVGVSVAGGSGF